MPAERWLPVTSFEGLYEVSDQGRVKRVGRDEMGRARYMGHILKGGRQPPGYTHHCLRKDGRTFTLLTHRLVMEAFVGVCPDGKQVNHKSGEKSDNRLTNLEHVTPSQNCRHALDVLGHRPPCGSKHHAAKLTEKKVRRIRQIHYETGRTHQSIGEEFGVARSVVTRILNRQWWKHVE